MATAEHALNLNQLRTFEAVARLASFTAAARELAISQPAVTVQVRELEGHFGLPLVDRSRAARAVGAPCCSPAMARPSTATPPRS